MTFFLHDEGHQLGIFYDVALSLPKYLYADLKIEKVFFLAKWKSVKNFFKVTFALCFSQIDFLQKGQ